MAFTNESKAGSILFGVIGATGLLACLSLILTSATNGAVPDGLSSTLFVAGVGGAVISTWLGNVRALRS